MLYIYIERAGVGGDVFFRKYRKNTMFYALHEAGNVVKQRFFVFIVFNFRHEVCALVRQYHCSHVFAFLFRSTPSKSKSAMHTLQVEPT